jgi:hypothetical protein
MSPQELLGTEKNDKLTLVIIVNRDKFNDPAEAMIEIIKRIRSVIGESRDFELISVSRGSIKVRIALGPDEALRLLAAIEEGQFDECGVESASLEELGDEHRDMLSVVPLWQFESEPGESVAPLWQFESKPRDSVSALTRLLHAEDPAIRRFAKRALLRLGPVLVWALHRLRGDPDPDVRKFAARVSMMLAGEPAHALARACRAKVEPRRISCSATLFGMLALGMAVVCFLLAAVFAFGQVGNRLLGVVICLFVGLMMLTIGMTAFWPRRPKRP